MHMGDQRDQRDRGEELAVVVGLLVGKLGEEVFVDAAKDIACDRFQLLGVEGAQQLAEHLVVQFLVFALGQDAAQVVVILFNGLHRLDDGLCAIGAVGQRDEIVELRLRPQINGALLGEVLLGQRARLAATTGKRRLDLRLHREIAAVGVAEEDQAHHRQEVFIAGVVGVGAQVVGGAPESCFDGFDVFELGHVGFGFRYFAVVSVRPRSSLRTA